MPEGSNGDASQKSETGHSEMNLETQSFNLNSVKNEFKFSLENINPYELVCLFERCKKNGSLNNAIRFSKRQDRIWGYNKMNSSSNTDNGTGGATKTPTSHNIFNSNSGSAQESKQGGDLGPSVSQQLHWNQNPSSPPAVKPTDEKWLEPEDFFENVVNLIGDREKYAENEYVREWFNKRQRKSDFIEEPILWHIHRLCPPSFILSTPEFPEEKILVDLLRTIRHPHFAYRKKTICVFVEQSQIETLVRKLNLEEISVVVLTGDSPQDAQESNSIFLTTEVRNVGNRPVDNLVNYQMFRTATQYTERLRLLRRRGHMTTFFNPLTDSELVPSLVNELKERKIEIPAFLRNRSGEMTEHVRR